MVENKDLREEQDRGGSDPNEVFDYAYFRTKFNITTEEVITQQSGKQRPTVRSSWKSI